MGGEWRERGVASFGVVGKVLSRVVGKVFSGVVGKVSFVLGQVFFGGG
jgi:hypothetical protein